MNIPTSDCSSGCESGWTSYLDQFSYSSGQFYRDGGANEEEEDEDMSMVSDASSGPPHFFEDIDFLNGNENFCYATLDSEQKKKTKQKKKECKGKKQSSNLDDTASSSALSFSKRNAALSNNQTSIEHVQAFSHDFSATCFKKHSGFLQRSVVPREAAPEKGGSLQRRK